MTSSWLGLDTAEWAIVVATAAAIIGLFALVTSWVLGLKANAESTTANEIAERASATADRANEVAERALAIEEQRLQQEQRAIVLPERYEPNGGLAIFRVITTNPLQQVEFEFRNYAGVGGLLRIDHVTAGEHRLPLSDFDESSDLEKPGNKEFVARARWKRMDSDEWEESGLHRAIKGALNFKRDASYD